MGTRPVARAGVVAVGVFATVIAILLWPQDEGAPPPGEPIAAARDPDGRNPARAPADPAAPATPARASVGHGADAWLESLSGRGEPLVAEDDDPHAVVIRGQLTVRQRRWVHPANVDVRLTRSLLDTVVPTDAGVQDDLAPAGDDPVTKTDAEGRFAFRFRPTNGELFFLIDRDGPWLDFQRVRSVPRIGNELDLGEVLVDDRGGISGTVLDEIGRPVAGALVRAVDDPLLGQSSELDELRGLRNENVEHYRSEGTLTVGPIPRWAVRRDRFLPFPRTTTDSSGRFTLRGVRPGAHDVFVQAQRGSARTDDIQVAVDRVTQVGVITVDTATEIELRFVDERNEPWVSAQVALIHTESGFGGAPVWTDGRGNATCRAFGDYRVAFAYPGGGPWIALSPRLERLDRHQKRGSRARVRIATLRVPRPQNVEVRLVDELGTTITNGRVRLFLRGHAFRPVDRALPGGMQPSRRADGVHVGRAPSAVVAVGSAPGFAPAMGIVDPRKAGPVNLTMLPLLRVTVRAHDRAGRPVEGALVRMQVHHDEEQDFPGSGWTLLSNDRVRLGRTGPDGTLSVGVWNTLMSFVAEHRDFAPSPGGKLRPVTGQDVPLLMRATATLQGRLSFNRRPAPAGFRLRARHRPPAAHELRESGWLGEHLAVTGEGGEFAFRGLCAGIWEVGPELPSVPGVTGPTRVPREFKTLQVSLDEGQEVWRNIEGEFEEFEAPQLAGTVAINGARVQDALVRVQKIERSEWRRRRGAPQELRLTTDAFGDFAFAGLARNAHYELTVEVPDHDRLQFLHREVVRTPASRTAGPERIDVDVRCGTLQLYCLRDDRPFGNRMLRLRRAADGDGKEPDRRDAARWSVLTTALGECVVDRLPAGTWSVEPVHGGRCEPAEFTITPGAVVMRTVNVVPE